MKAASASRNAYIDTLRGVSILGVVCVHFAGSFVTTDIHAWSPSFFLGLVLNQGANFAVPLFVFLSGLLAGLSRSSPGLWTYYSGRFWRIAFPYLIASAAAFFLLNHYTRWQALPGLQEKIVWLVQHVGFFGVEPTLYFIPLILQLYLLQPLLKQLPGWCARLLPGITPTASAAAITALLLALHIWIGLKSYEGALNYYIWARPNAAFWAFYFFLGLHFSTLTSRLSRRVMLNIAGIAGLTAIAAMLWNFLQLTNPAVVGPNFEFNRLDFAYTRPELMIYDFAMIIALGAGVALGWSPRPTPFAYLGRYTLEIYLWHILVLYYGAWRFPVALESCRKMPELIVIICIAAAVLIAVTTDLLRRGIAFAKAHRIALITVPETPPRRSG
ncbi:MAG: acyltransferase [Opitutaceae bacterium]|nr:acyltransferase [Cephaloticoccus sp.]MCP5531079.1 acyltransferase [Opitutaceae bacterium]